MKKQQVFLLVPQEDVEEIRNTLRDIKGQLSGNKNKVKVLGDYISEKEAQELLNRKTTWFWQKRKSGELSGKKAGNQWFYRKEDIISFIDNGITGA
jgi:hypothetical protein